MRDEDEYELKKIALLGRQAVALAMVLATVVVATSSSPSPLQWSRAVRGGAVAMSVSLAILAFFGGAAAYVADEGVRAAAHRRRTILSLCLAPFFVALALLMP